MQIRGFLRAAAVALTALLALDPSQAAGQNASRIIGRVTEADGVTGVAGAQVFVAELDRGAITGEDGGFVIAGVSAGERTVGVLMLGYAPIEVGVHVDAGESAAIVIPIVPAAIAIEGLTVEVARSAGSAVALDAERRASSIVQDAIGRDQIERSTDGDAAAVVARVPGVTVVGGKYVYVRGLGDRYGSTTLNGAPLATPEPDRKTVPLDLIPSSFLESVITAKTYSPDQPADYAGGLVQLRTRGYPQLGLLRITASGAYDTEATFASGLAYGSSLNAVGLPDGERRLPAAIARDVEVRAGTYSPQQLEQIGEAFAPTWAPRAEDLPANRSFGITTGDSWLVGDRGMPLGFLATGTWSNAVDNRANEIERVFASGGGAEPEVDYIGLTSTQSIELGGMLEIGFDPADGHRFSLTSVFNRTADDQARQLDGFVLDANTNLRNYRLRYLAQTMASAQLAGEHELGDARLDWRADARYAGRSEPNTREVVYMQGADGVYRWENFIQSGSVFHQDLDELGGGGALDVTLPFGTADAFRLGASADLRARDVYTRRFRFLPQVALDAATRELAPDLLFSAPRIAPDSFQIQEATFAGDNYDATQSIYAAYAVVDWTPFDRLRVSGGARVEAAMQQVDPVDPFGGTASTLAPAELDDIDVLPALNLTFALGDAMNLRLAASQTLARPQFREIAPFAYADYAGGHLVRGNPILERSLIRNLDARWEWFPSYGAVVALSAFAKRFDQPIEVLVFQQGAELAKTWVNAGEAGNHGVEIEARSDLGFISDALATLTLNSNLTMVRSEVRTHAPVRVALPEIGTLAFDAMRDGRPLQGQSPYALNLGASWQHPTLGTGASVLFNRFGRRIESVGVQPLPDIYEEARSTLDIVVQQPIGDSWSIELSAERVLGDRVEFTQGGDLLRSWDPGRLFTLSVSWGGGE